MARTSHRAIAHATTPRHRRDPGGALEGSAVEDAPEVTDGDKADDDVNYFTVMRSLTNDPEILRALDAAEQDDSELPLVVEVSTY